jgi:LPXTG-motif cell wall-anchored protein
MGHPVRILAAAAALTLVAAGAGLAPAGAQTSGVGTSLAGTTVLSVDLGGGSILALDVLADEARSTVDGAVADPSAYSRLQLLALSSEIAPAINALDDNIPVVESRTPGGSPSVETVALDLAVPPEAVAGTGALASGTITPARLTSSLTDGTALSSLVAEIAAVNVGGGLLNVDAVGSELSTAAGPAGASATRQVSIEAVTVLDLGAVLQGLGIDLAALPVDTVLALVDELGLPISVSDTLPAGSSLADYVNGLRNTIDLINSETDLTDTVDALIIEINDLLAPTGIEAPSAGDTLQETLDALEPLLVATVEEVAAVLDGAPLLALDGVTVAVQTAAADTLAATTASVTGAIGGVRIGSLALDGVDLLGAAQAVSDLVAAIDAQIGTVLGLVDPDLADLVSISVLDQETSVATSDGYNRARAGITGVTATITPPSNLAEIVATVTSSTEPLSSLIDTAGLSDAMNELEAVLNVGVAALSQPSTVRAVEVLSASDFRPGTAAPGGPTPVNELPRTGTSWPLALGAAVLATAALLIRRLLPTLRRT